MFCDNMKCHRLKYSQWLNLARLTLSCVIKLYRDASHQWMKTFIFMHKNVDFPALISITNDVPLITTDTATTTPSPKRIRLASLDSTQCHESHRVPTSLPRNEGLAAFRKHSLSVKFTNIFIEIILREDMHLIKDYE